ADHADFGVAVLRLRLFLRHRMHVDSSQAGNVSHGMLEDRPEPARLVKTLVGKTDRQKPVELIEHAEHVETQPPPAICMAYDLPLPCRLDADANVGASVYLHQAVGTFSGNAQQTARPVVFEAPAKNLHAGCIQSRANALASARWNGPALENKGDLLIPI